jgi:hypothetical protein
MPTGDHVYRFVDFGVTAAHVESMVPGTTTIVSVVVSPLRYCDVRLSDGSADPEADIAAGMLDVGFVLLEVDPQLGAIQVPAQILPSKLGADAAVINFGASWVDVFSTDITTKGGSRLAAIGAPIFSCTLGGEYRLLIDGGSFSPGTVLVDPIALALESRKPYPVQSPVEIPATANYTTYTVKLQAQATILTGTVTPKKDSALSLFEYRGI